MASPFDEDPSPSLRIDVGSSPSTMSSQTSPSLLSTDVGATDSDGGPKSLSFTPVRDKKNVYLII
jgi:hypothetical protein